VHDRRSHNVAFSHHPGKEFAFLGIASHPWRLTWVPLADSEPYFPDPGDSAVRIGVARCGPNPCLSQEFCPLQLTNQNPSRRKNAVLVLFGCVAFASATVTAEAQTYYYYPSTTTSAPSVMAGTASAPTYYYRRGLFGRRHVWTGYVTPVYQATNSLPSSEPVSQVQSASQAAPAQTLTGGQLIPASYTKNEPEPAAATAPTSAATTAPSSTAMTAPSSVAAVALASTAMTGPASAATTAPARAAMTAPETSGTTPPESTATTAPATTEPGDPYGFTGWLNATRAAYGLPPVGHDPNLSSWAAENNNHQAARGMGHFVMGPARRQNAAFGSVANIGAMWMNSPAHRAALLDPTIRWIGIAGLGVYWTFNAY